MCIQTKSCTQAINFKSVVESIRSWENSDLYWNYSVIIQWLHGQNNFLKIEIEFEKVEFLCVQYIIDFIIRRLELAETWLKYQNQITDVVVRVV